jgi:2-haloacid dehalogenase
MHRPTWITFDCYGTLVDFDLNAVVRQALKGRTEGVDLAAFLRDWERMRFEEVLGPYRPYRQILRDSLRRAMERHGLAYRDADGDVVVAAVPTFEPFPDVPPTLEQLRQHYRLAIISNTDDDLITGNLEKIGVPFDCVVTAEQARAYKPSLDAFRYLFQQLGSDPREIVHVAQGFEYDIVPAHTLDLRCVWINRRGQRRDLAYGPYDELSDLTGLTGLLGIEQGT